MAPSQVGEWLKQIGEGDLSTLNVKKILSTSSGQSRLAITFLAQLSHRINKLATNSVCDIETDPRNVADLSLACCEYTTLLDLSARKLLVQSLYHIIKYLLDQGMIQEAECLRGYVVTTLPSYCNEDSACTNAYLCISNLFKDVAMSLEVSYAKDSTRTRRMDCLDAALRSLELLACGSRPALNHILSRLVAHSDWLEDLAKFHCDGFKAAARPVYGEDPPDDHALSRKICQITSKLLGTYLAKGEFALSMNIIEAAGSCAYTILGPDSVPGRSLVLFHRVIRVLLATVDGDPNDLSSKLRVINDEFEDLVDSSNGDFNITLCTCLYRVLQDLSAHWMKFTDDEWNCRLSVAVQPQLYRLMLQIVEVLHQKDVGMLQSTLLASLVFYCVQKCAVHKTPGYQTLVPQGCVVLKECSDLLAGLKEAQELLWVGCWQKLAVNAYNLAYICYSDGLFQESKTILSVLWRASLKLEDKLDQSPLCFKDIILSLLHLWSRTYHALHKPKMSLFVLAAGLVFAPSLKAKLLRLWVEVKSHGDMDLQRCTVADIINEKKNVLNSLNPGLCEIDTAELLLWELEAYEKATSFLMDCADAAAERLLAVGPTLAQRCRGIVVLSRLIWLRDGVEGSDRAILLCKETVAMVLDTTDAPEYLMLVAQLRHMVFLHHFKLTHAKQRAEVEASQVFPNNSTKYLFGEIHDPNNSCDERPSYLDLTVVRERELLGLLDEGVELFHCAVEKGVPESAEVLNISSVLRTLEEAAHIYTLFGFPMDTVRVWGIHYKLARMVGNKEDQLKGLCHLMERYTCIPDSMPLLRLGSLASELDLDAAEENQRELAAETNLSLAEHYYWNHRYYDGVTHLHIVKTLEGLCSPLVKARYKLTVCRYLLLPCGVLHAKDLGELDTLHTLVSAYSIIHHYCKATMPKPTTISMYYQSIALCFEVSLLMGELHLELNWPREIRCYLKDYFLLAQKLALSTSRPSYLSSALAPAAPTTLPTAWTGPQSMFFEPSVTTPPQYPAPALAIGSREGHYLSLVTHPGKPPLLKSINKLLSFWKEHCHRYSLSFHNYPLPPIATHVAGTVILPPTATHVAGTVLLPPTATHVAGTVLLPPTATHFLSLLTQADLLCGKLDDAQVKLWALRHLLCLPGASSHCSMGPVSPQHSENYENLDLNLISGLDGLRLDPVKVTINTPSRVPLTADTQGSPILREHSYSSPEFLSHQRGCRCAFCANIIAQAGVLGYITMQGKLFLYKRQFEMALDYFLGGSILTPKLAQRQDLCLELLTSHSSLIEEKGYPNNLVMDHTNKVLKQHPDGFNMSCWALNLCGDLNRSHVRFLLSYAELCGCQSQLMEAIKLNEQAYEVSKQLRDLYLFLEALLQKVSLRLMSTPNITQDTRMAEEFRETKVLPLEIPNSIRTPITRRLLFSDLPSKESSEAVDITPWRPPPPKLRVRLSTYKSASTAPIFDAYDDMEDDVFKSPPTIDIPHKTTGKATSCAKTASSSRGNTNRSKMLSSLGSPMNLSSATLPPKPRIMRRASRTPAITRDLVPIASRLAKAGANNDSKFSSPDLESPTNENGPNPMLSKLSTATEIGKTGSKKIASKTISDGLEFPGSQTFTINPAVKKALKFLSNSSEDSDKMTPPDGQSASCTSWQSDVKKKEKRLTHGKSSSSDDQCNFSLSPRNCSQVDMKQKKERGCTSQRINKRSQKETGVQPGQNKEGCLRHNKVNQETQKESIYVRQTPAAIKLASKSKHKNPCNTGIKTITPRGCSITTTLSTTNTKKNPRPKIRVFVDSPQDEDTPKMLPLVESSTATRLTPRQLARSPEDKENQPTPVKPRTSHRKKSTRSNPFIL
uniref:Separase n=1 Tax=Timema cristinae TaxID=61476 RepID=A0A7R9CIT7_TIMCR|nr:unnamed protein product [Timema cristinae]